MTNPDHSTANLAARKRAKAEKTLSLAASVRYDAKLAAAKSKVERKSRKSLKLYHDKIKREGKKTVTVRPIAPISIIKSDLNIWEQTASEDLIAAYRSSIGAPVARDPEMIDAPIAQVRWDLADEIAAKQSDLARAYQQWRGDLTNTAAFTVAKEVLFAETSLSAIDKHYRWRKGTAKKHLVASLRHFATIRGNVPRHAHDWKFDPTQPIKERTK